MIHQSTYPNPSPHTHKEPHTQKQKQKQNTIPSSHTTITTHTDPPIQNLLLFSFIFTPNKIWTQSKSSKPKKKKTHHRSPHADPNPFRPHRLPHTSIHLSKTFFYFLSSSHQTKTKHNPRVLNPPPPPKKNPPPKPSRHPNPFRPTGALSWFKPIEALTPAHRPTFVKPIGAHQNHNRSHRSSDSNPSEPSNSTVVKTHGVLGLKRADEKERRKREKRGEIMREEREIPGWKSLESIKKLFFSYTIQPFSYSTILNIRWHCTSMPKKFDIFQV